MSSTFTPGGLLNSTPQMQAQLAGPAGASNVPNNLFGQQGFMPQGFSGYNANNANIPGQSQMQYGQQQNPYGPAQYNPYQQMMGGGMSSQGGYGNGYPSYQQPGNGFNPSQLNSSSILQQAASGQGYGAAVNTLPAWQSGVQAQQYNIQQGADQLAEQFNNGGGLFSNAYGSAQGQYQEQATLGQNAQLSQAMLQAQEAAQGIQSQAGSQFSSQGYGAAQTQYQGGLQANENLMNNQLGYAGLGMQSATGLGNLYQTYLGGAESAANQYPAQQYNQGWLAPVIGAAGSALGGIGSILQSQNASAPSSPPQSQPQSLGFPQLGSQGGPGSSYSYE